MYYKEPMKNNKAMFNLFCGHYRCFAVVKLEGYGSTAHFVVFDERKFGFVWLYHPKMFSLYIRVDDNELKD